ncbi:MAG TPA: hypothetical protein VKX33_12270, partial [Cyclobacteriaceae bacterium]|nr:hypothetical protein [Cyclobacteriaceae bacterium]
MYTKPDISFENIQVAFASKSDKALKKMYLIFSLLDNNLMAKWGVVLAVLSLKLRLPVKSILKRTIFDHFCGGESIQDSRST